MATPYADIYDRALFKINDPKLATMDVSDKRFILRRYLWSAISDLQNKCEKDLDDRDENIESFNIDLTGEEMEILALGMSFYWFDSKVKNEKLLKNKLSTKDYTYFSPANLLREANVTRESIYKEYKRRITDYTYEHGNISMQTEGAV